MKNECLNLLDTQIQNQEPKTLTENLKTWRKDRNINSAITKVFVENIIEELLEIYFDDKELIKTKKNLIMTNFFLKKYPISHLNTLDAIQDIQVFCINETELMGYNNIKCNNEVFKHINCRKQDPIQMIEWKEKGAVGKWKKWSEQPEDEIYQPNYESCKI